MRARWKSAACLVLCGALAGSATAQNILLKDGKTIVTKGLRRQGDTIMATVETILPARGTEPAKTLSGEIGYQLPLIAKLDFPAFTCPMIAIVTVTGSSAFLSGAASAPWLLSWA